MVIQLHLLLLEICKNVTIATGGTLVVSGGDLTVGCTLNNNTLANSGT